MVSPLDEARKTHPELKTYAFQKLLVLSPDVRYKDV